MNVQNEHSRKPYPKDPKEKRSWEKAAAEAPQGFGVFVELDGAFVDVEVADHVDNYEAQQADACEGHNPFTSD